MLVNVCPVLVTNARMKIQLAHNDFKKMGYSRALLRLSERIAMSEFVSNRQHRPVRVRDAVQTRIIAPRMAFIWMFASRSRRRAAAFPTSGHRLPNACPFGT